MLDHVTVDLPASAMVAIIGPSGAGKSTLVDMLPRLVEPQAGRIYLDDIDLATIRLSEIRRNIAFVSQHTLLFDDTIEANLRYSRPDASQATIDAALRAAGADEFVYRLPEGLRTVVGENGALLSGGQRQRLALACAFLSGTAILVLDEPTSALDFESESVFRRTLASIRERGDTTLIIVAHRPSTIADADFVIVLRDGRVDEAAAPQTLRHDASYYRQMLEANVPATLDESAIASIDRWPAARTTRDVGIDHPPSNRKQHEQGR